MIRHPEWPEGAEEIYSAGQVAAGLDRLAESVAGRIGTGPVTVLVVMNGGMYPAVELTRRLDLPLTVDYVHASRYREQTTGSDIQWLRWPEQPLAGRTVVVVDDIFDEGYTLAAIRDRLGECGLVITAVLARKSHDRGLARDWVDHFALEVPDRYVFGCGMDYKGHWRHLPGIWAMPEEP